MADMKPVARPYAQALYEYAKENNIVSACSHLLVALLECVENNNIACLLNAPEYSQDDVAELLIEVLSGGLDDYAKNFIRLLAIHQRLPVIPSVYHLFLQYKAEDEQSKTARITTAFKVSASSVNKIKEKLEQKYRCGMTVEMVVDPGVIGGALIEIGDQVIDGSIKGKLDKLRHELQA